VIIGDWMRTSRPHLEKVINAGVRTAIYDGDADYICNYQGVENMVNALQHKYSSQYASTPWTTWKVDGVTAGQFKNAGPFSYVRVYRFVSRLEVFELELTSFLPGLAT
jgi:carboxypeptidase C (cathepsin A)